MGEIGASILRTTSLIKAANKTTTNNSDDKEISKRPNSSSSEGTESLISLHSKLDYLLQNNSTNNDDESDSAEWVENDGTKYLPIKRTHWRDSGKARFCESCNKDFRFGSKKYNCRRCGNVFCDSCCQYRKRLSPECEPDPQGNVYRVCASCADRHIQPIGMTNSHTESYCEFRKNKRLVIEDELKRLITGFEETVDPRSAIKSAIESLPSFKVPEWQKSSKWLESADVEWCSKCSSDFNFLTRKHHCRLCGYIYCNKCCKMSLLLYFDENKKGLAKLIGVVGCPDKEPSVSMYMNICNVCEEDLEEYQVQMYHLGNTGAIEQSNDKMRKLQYIVDSLNVIELKIKVSLSSFQEQLETFVFEDNPTKNMDGENNMEIFAKAYSDMSDLFTKYAITIQDLKKLKMSSNIELKLMQNVIFVKCNQYTIDTYVFKCLKCAMNKTFPRKSLEQFQIFANTQAINNTYIMTRQLGLEVLSIALKYNTGTTHAEQLSAADQICFSELENYLQSIGENKTKHIDVLNDLLKEQMKEKAFLELDKKQVEMHGNGFVNSFLVQRCSKILYKILKQLKAKSSETQFPKSKKILQELLNFFSDLHIKQEKNRL